MEGWLMHVSSSWPLARSCRDEPHPKPPRKGSNFHLPFRHSHPRRPCPPPRMRACVDPLAASHETITIPPGFFHHFWLSSIWYIYSMSLCVVVNFISVLNIGDCVAFFIWMPIWLLVWKEVALFEVFENFGFSSVVLGVWEMEVMLLLLCIVWCVHREVMGLRMEMWMVSLSCTPRGLTCIFVVLLKEAFFLASLLSSSVAVYSVSKLLCYMNLLYIVVRYRLYIVMRYWSWLTEITKLLS